MTDSRASVLLILAQADLTVYETEILFFHFVDRAGYRELAEFTEHRGVSRQAINLAYQKGLIKLRKVM
jgi:hypothetical protein